MREHSPTCNARSLQIRDGHVWQRGDFNWRRTGVCATTYVSAIMRHLNAWRDGEDLDPESGISHIAHIATSCNILMDAEACGTLQDDRNKRPGAGISGLGFRVYPDISVSQTATITPPLSPVAGQEADKRPILTQAEVGGKLVDLPPVPEGYSRWEDRGMGWDSRNKRVPCFAVRLDPEDPTCLWHVYHNDTANGVWPSRYLEAVKDATVKVVDHDIKPGDCVTGRLVRGENFNGVIANVVDIRGTKLFQFLDRPSLSEDEIHSITHA